MNLQPRILCHYGNEFQVEQMMRLKLHERCLKVHLATFHHLYRKAQPHQHLLLQQPLQPLTHMPYLKDIRQRNAQHLGKLSVRQLLRIQLSP